MYFLFALKVTTNRAKKRALSTGLPIMVKSCGGLARDISVRLSVSPEIMTIRHEPTADGGKATGTGLFSSYEFRNHRNAIGFKVFAFQDLGTQSEPLVITKTCKPSSADPGGL